MKIGIIGTGYVGLPSGVGFAEMGHDVICIDKDEKKVSMLKAGKVTLYEDGLEELLTKNFKAGKIKFTSSMKEGVEHADLIIIAVGTPPHPETKEADMRYINAAANELAEYLTGYTTICIKSTVPVGTGDNTEAIIRAKNPNADFDMVSLPEFLREGYAVSDFFHPDRIVIGTDSERARQAIRDLYKPFTTIKPEQMLFVKRRSSEVIKYASNAFLAMKIHYINEMANFCEKADADILEVAKGMGMDSRIGPKFLNPGPGYGGSCFPKDTLAMAFMGRKYNSHLNLIETTIAENLSRKKHMAHRISSTVKDNLDAKVTILGLAFKNGTDDCRESPAMEIILEMLEVGVKNITAYDPKAMEVAKTLPVGQRISYADNMYDACKDAEVVCILTEWDEFRSLDFDKLSKVMHGHRIVDCRNLLDGAKARQHGFTYRGIGR